MPVDSEMYQRLVLDDLKSYVGLNHPVKTGFLGRLLTRRLPVSSLHPNPTDEFSNPAIGPAMDVVTRYVEEWADAVKHGLRPEMEPLFVEKMSVGGYMLLDGHHRWYAAHQLKMKSLPVRVMNVTPMDELLSRISASQRQLCVSFDLEEVLLTSERQKAEKKPTMSLGDGLNRGKKYGLRKNVPAMIKSLHEMGFDVWVYTAGYMPEDALRKLFRHNGVTVDGVLSGLRNSGTGKALHKAISEKYEVLVHIDNQGMTAVELATKKNSMVDISAGDTDWCAKSFAAVRSDPIVLAHLRQK